jgi:hypothetical protein
MPTNEIDKLKRMCDLTDEEQNVINKICGITKTNRQKIALEQFKNVKLLSKGEFKALDDFITSDLYDIKFSNRKKISVFYNVINKINKANIGFKLNKYNLINFYKSHKNLFMTKNKIEAVEELKQIYKTLRRSCNAASN